MNKVKLRNPKTYTISIKNIERLENISIYLEKNKSEVLNILIEKEYKRLSKQGLN